MYRLADLRAEAYPGGMSTMEAKLDLILSKVIGLEQDLGSMKTDLGSVKTDLGSVKTDLGSVKTDLGSVKTELSDLKGRADRQDARIDELVAAFRQNWANLSGLYRRVLDDVKSFEDRLASKISQVNQSIVALKESIDNQDYRSDTLGRRITALEERPHGLDR
jgi:septal ring factor EnvC (AmiA/AmiB activator)